MGFRGAICLTLLLVASVEWAGVARASVPERLPHERGVSELWHRLVKLTTDAR